MPKGRSKGTGSAKTTIPSSDTIKAEPETVSITNQIDLNRLSSIVNDLIVGKRDQSAYEEFLSILEHFFVRTLRDDHMEETVYHLIQAAVTFIRVNEQRFDRTRLEQCYRQRHQLRSNSTP